MKQADIFYRLTIVTKHEESVNSALKQGDKAFLSQTTTDLIGNKEFYMVDDQNDELVKAKKDFLKKLNKINTKTKKALMEMLQNEKI